MQLIDIFDKFIQAAHVFRIAAFILALTFVLTGTGVAGHIHEVVVHGHSGTLHVASAGHDRDSKPIGHDESLCVVCLTLHAPFTAPQFWSFDVALQQAVEGVIVLQAQRLDASVPSRRGCRGPPVA